MSRMRLIVLALVAAVVVIGDRRKFLTCLVMIDHENVVKFAQDRNVPFTNFASLCRAKAVNDLIGEEVEKVNVNFARVEEIWDRACRAARKSKSPSSKRIRKRKPKSTARDCCCRPICQRRIMNFSNATR